LTPTEHWPALSKYSVLVVPNVTRYCGDVAEVVARISAITDAMILVAAVCEVALRFVCTPTGIKPKTAIKQNAAIPIARVNSTRENAAVETVERFIADKC
jgi:hypothetical protein